MAMQYTEDDKRSCTLSEKYTEYISRNIEALQLKCKEFTVCINELLSHQSAFALISGEDISLRTVCGLFRSDGSNAYSFANSNGTCTTSERGNIKKDFEQHLVKNIPDQPEWNKVKKCLGNNYGDNERSTYVNEICGLVQKQDHLCKKRDIHKQVESFFNEELHRLRCTCKSLNDQSGNLPTHARGIRLINSTDSVSNNIDSTDPPLGAILGGVIGGLTLLILAILLAIFCYKYKRAKNKKSTPNIIYLPAPNSEYQVYQEVFDDPYDPRYRPSPSNPPALPNRPRYHQPNEDSTYLEPVPPGSYRGKLQPPVSNPNYDEPPEYSEWEEAPNSPNSPNSPPSPNSQSDHEYFEPLPAPRDVSEEYDILVTDEEVDTSAQPRYEPFNSFKSDIKLGPDPSERTKKEDRETESTYFELEKVSEEEQEIAEEPTHTTV